jgi:hypothetical protein
MPKTPLLSRKHQAQRRRIARFRSNEPQQCQSQPIQSYVDGNFGDSINALPQQGTDPYQVDPVLPPVSSTQDELIQEEHYCGKMDDICEFCHSKNFCLERPSDRKFTNCCQKGKVVLPPFKEYPVKAGLWFTFT